MARADIKRRLDAKLRAAIEPVIREYEKFAAVPAKERAEWHETYEGEYYRSDVDNAIRETFGVPADAPSDPSRFVHVEVTARPKGSRLRILSEVSQIESQRRKQIITTRFVDRCWKEYREFLRSCDDSET